MLKKSAIDTMTPFLYLLIGLVLLYFSFLNRAIPIAAWLAPAFLMRFSRSDAKRAFLAIALVPLAVTYYLIWRPTMQNLNPVIMGILIVGMALMLSTALLADRVLKSRLSPLESCLVFPLAWTAIEYGRSFIESSGSHGSLAYSQFGWLPVMQVASVAGIWGITFLVAFFAPVANLILDAALNPEKRKRVLLPAIAFGGLLAAALAFGLARQSIDTARERAAGASIAGAGNAGAKSFRVATVTKTSTVTEFADIYGRGVFRPIADYGALIEEYSAKAAAGGAKALLWQEYFFQIPEDKKPELLALLESAASRYGIYEIAGITLYDPPPRKASRNTAVIADPRGTLAVDYAKKHLVVGIETSRMIPGDGVMRAIDTEWGRWTLAICYENDFPAYVAQAGRMGADTLFMPTLDWPGLVPFHSYMSVFRGIENGCAIVKCAGYGLTLVADRYGRIVASEDDTRTDGTLFFADVPARGRRTLYAETGDAFAWIAILALAFVIARAVKGKKPREFRVDR